MILVDVSMPELDGFELAEMIREHPRCRETAIIFVSAVHLTDTDRLKGYQSGAVDYVSVPVVPELLRAKVRVFAELHRRRREAEALARELEQRVAERTAELEASMARQTELALTRLLRVGGHEVLLAHDPADALRLASAEQPTVILLDIGMPGMDGYEVCRRLRQQGPAGALIVAMTGYGLERDRVRSREAGFDTHRVKPVDPSELLRLMATHAGGPRSGVCLG